MNGEVCAGPALGPDQPVDGRLRLVVDHGRLAARPENRLLFNGERIRIVVVLVNRLLKTIDRLPAKFLLKPGNQSAVELLLALGLRPGFVLRVVRLRFFHIVASLNKRPF